MLIMTGYNAPLLDSDVNVAKKMFDVNVFAVIEVTKAFAPLLIASKGTIVNIGSIVGHFPLPCKSIKPFIDISHQLRFRSVFLSSPAGFKLMILFPGSGYYNATKAAVNLLSEQLRLELAPFDVNAINVTTGVVSSKFFKNAHGSKLPINSLYAPAKDIIEPTMDGEGLEMTDVDAYAAAVVKNTLKSSPTKDLWVGANTFNIWFLGTFGWSSIWVICSVFHVRLHI